MKRFSAKKLACILTALLILTGIGGTLVGSVPINVYSMWELFRCRLSGKIVPPELQKVKTILEVLRIPRTVLMILSGAALAGSGASYQGLFRNPLADPYLIGISSGAGLGAVIAMTVDIPYSRAGIWLKPLFAFVFASLTVLLVFRLGRSGSHLNTGDLLLAGVAVNAFASSLTSAYLLIGGTELRRSYSWMLGGAGAAGWREISVCAPLILIGLIGQFSSSYALNVLQFGDEQAEQLGIPVKRTRVRVIIFATLTTASAIAFTGIIGFVGLVIPHLLRILIGNDYRKLLPLCALGGAFFLAAADIPARLLLAPQEIPVGIVTAICGVPFFLRILHNSKKAKV